MQKHSSLNKDVNDSKKQQSPRYEK